MDDQRAELEFDEFEKLLGEIPNATSGNPHSEEGELKSVSLHGSLAPICVNSCKGPLTEKLQHNSMLDEGKLMINRTRGSPIKRVQSEEVNLPDDQSLTSAFAKLSFRSASPTNCSASPCRAVLLDCNYTNCAENSHPSRDSPVMVVSPFQSPNSLPCGFDEYNVTKSVQESSNLLKLDTQEQKKMLVGYCQTRPSENFTALPLAHGMQGFQFVSNAPLPDVEFPLASDQQGYFADVQPPFPYLHLPQLNQSHISWRNIEGEQYYRMHQQYVYLQQLRNQRLEAPHPIQVNGNIANKLIGQNARQPCFEVPITQQFQQSNQASFYNNYGVTRGLNQSQNAIQVFDKVGKQSLPEKILTRSLGLNPIKTMKFGSLGGNESIAHLNQNGKDLSNGHLCHGLSNPTAGCFKLDHLSSWNLSPDMTNIKVTNIRTTPQKYNSIDDFTGRIYLMAKDQHGCRFLQRKFSEGTPQDIEKIFLEIIGHIVELMTDPFGNYLVQKLLEVCDEDQQMQILHAITGKPGELVRISCDMHGTRAVQKVIETLKTPEQCSLVVNSLKLGIVTLMKNMNGNHVAQRCLQYLWDEYREFLFDAATANCIELATDRHGCCVLQKCLTYSEGAQRCRLASEVTSNALILSQDPFGNYVVQFVLELQLPWATADILNQLEGNYGDLSMQKYSSNVVEKCLKYAGEECHAHIIQELINNTRLDQIMQDPYGNYVIQAALHQSKNDQGTLHSTLVEAIRPHFPMLRTSPYGKKVLTSEGLKK